MAFDRQQSNIPTSIGEIRIMIADSTGVASDMRAGFFVRVLNQNGDLYREIEGDLVPHLTTAQINGLIQFMHDLRILAISEILPNP